MPLSLPLPGLVTATKLGKSSKRKNVSSAITTGALPDSASINLVKKSKAVDGFGTDAGLYPHPSPDFNLITLKEAVAETPMAANPKITIKTADNEIIREFIHFVLSFFPFGHIGQTILRVLTQGSGSCIISPPLGVFSCETRWRQTPQVRGVQERTFTRQVLLV